MRYLFSLPELNLTSQGQAALLDNYIINIELQPPVKAQALDYLKAVEAAGSTNATGLPTPPPRNAAVQIVQGQAKPPKIIQVRVVVLMLVIDHFKRNLVGWHGFA